MFVIVCWWWFCVVCCECKVYIYIDIYYISGGIIIIMRYIQVVQKSWYRYRYRYLYVVEMNIQSLSIYYCVCVYIGWWMLLFQKFSLLCDLWSFDGVVIIMYCTPYTFIVCGTCTRIVFLSYVYVCVDHHLLYLKCVSGTRFELTCVEQMFVCESWECSLVADTRWWTAGCWFSLQPDLRDWYL